MPVPVLHPHCLSCTLRRPQLMTTCTDQCTICPNVTPICAEVAPSLVPKSTKKSHGARWVR